MENKTKNNKKYISLLRVIGLLCIDPISSWATSMYAHNIVIYLREREADITNSFGICYMMDSKWSCKQGI